MPEFNKVEIARLIKERKVVFVGKGKDHIIRNELDVQSMWETLENGILLTKELLCQKLPEKTLDYKWPYYFMHKLRKFWIFGKPVLLGFYVSAGWLRIGHFSGCSAEVKFQYSRIGFSYF